MKKAILVLSIGVLAAGCGSTRPPAQLTDARVAYQRASTSPAASLVATDLHDVRATLSEAEQSFSDHGDSDKTRTLAYVAQRRAIAVEAKGNAVRALEQKRVAETEFQRFREHQALAMRSQLDQAKSALSMAQQQAESERQARTSAENKTQQLLVQIEGLKTSESERGLVLTLSGSILFASGRSQLLPEARRRLTDVAKAVKEDKRSLIVVGHTDATGRDEMNKQLSEARAKAVRQYLVQQGIEDGRIKAEGMGESQPVADNASPEGRANNRRVEIILERGSVQQGGGGGAGGPSGPTK